jgi:uncharacterized lipoprotein YajG
LRNKTTITQKNLNMKKVLFVLALGAFAACGSGEKKDATVDTTAAPAVDTTAVVDTAAAPAADTTAAAVDTAAKK